MQTRKFSSILKKILIAIILIIVVPFTILVIIALIKGPDALKISNESTGPTISTTTSVSTITTPAITDFAANDVNPATVASTSEIEASVSNGDIPHPAVTHISTNTTDFIDGQTKFSIIKTTNNNGYVVVNVDVKNFPFKERVLADTGTAAVKIFKQKFTEYPNATGVNVIYRCLKLSETSSCISYYVGKDTYKKVNWSKMFGDELCNYLREEGGKTGDSKCIVTKSELR